jgi:hypothetical protein
MGNSHNSNTQKKILLLLLIACLSIFFLYAVRECFYCGGSDLIKSLNLSGNANNICNKTHLEERINETFGFLPDEYAVSSSECEGLWGDFKARGILMDGNEFELYYSPGISSSGGGYGHTYCFSVKDKGDNKYLADFRKNVCKGLSNYCSNRWSPFCDEVELFDNTSETIQDCLNGAFDQTYSSWTSLSLIESGNRCCSEVLVGSSHCCEGASE